MWVIHTGPTVNLNELLSVGQKDLPKYFTDNFNFCVYYVSHIYLNAIYEHQTRWEFVISKNASGECNVVIYLLIFVNIGGNLCTQIIMEFPHRLITIFHLCLLSDLNENCNERVQGYLKWYIVVTQCLSKLNMMFRWLEFPSLPAPM
jgi:hypothetical protein